MFLVLGRTIKEGLSNFWRNGWLSVASVSVLLLSLLILGILYIVGVSGNEFLENTKDKVNVSIFFLIDTPEENIMQAKKDLEGFAEVKTVDYVSREKALEDFKNNNADVPVIIQSLEEIGENPLQASLIVKANDTTQYDKIMEYISNAPFKDDVSRVNYTKYKDLIDKLNKTDAELKRVGMVLGIMFATISVLIIFNTIRITIYTHRQEIEVMRLVGASNTYIRLPFIFEGIMYGIIAAVVSTALTYFVVKTITVNGTSFPVLLKSRDLLSIYTSNIAVLLAGQLFLGITLGVVSSTVAIRKYLKI